MTFTTKTSSALRVLLTGVLPCVAIALLSSCSPPADPPADGDRGGSDFFSNDGSADGIKTGGGSPEIATTPSAERKAVVSPAPEDPDWEALKRELVPKYMKDFVAPTPGEKMVLMMKSGDKKPCILEKVEGSMVHVKLANGTVGLPATALHPSSQVKLFARAYAQNETLKDLRVIRDKHVKAVAAWESAQQARKMARAKASGKAVVPVNDPKKNGAVPAVVEYLRDYVRNPETVRFRKWGKVQSVPKGGWQVSLEYSFDTESMGEVVTHKWFIMDRTGKVFRTALYKDPASMPTFFSE